MPPCDHDECPSSHCLQITVDDPGYYVDVREIGRGGLQDQIDQWLKSLGNRCFYVHSRCDKRTTYQVGTADFLGWIRHEGRGFGFPFAVEVKRKGQKPTLQQMARLKQAECAGAVVGIVHSLEEFKKLLNL